MSHQRSAMDCIQSSSATKNDVSIRNAIRRRSIDSRRPQSSILVER